MIYQPDTDTGPARTLAELRKVFLRGEVLAFRRWAGKQDLKTLKRFCRDNGVPIDGQKTRDKMLEAILTLVSVPVGSCHEKGCRPPGER